jgi:hypothetical protein
MKTNNMELRRNTHDERYLAEQRKKDEERLSSLDASPCSPKSHPEKFVRSLMRMIEDGLQSIEARKDWPANESAKTYRRGRKNVLEMMEREIKARAKFYGIDF